MKLRNHCLVCLTLLVACGDDSGTSFDAATGRDTSFPDTGLAEPAWVDLDVVALGGCPAFTACGGDIVGTWDVTDGCFEVDIESAIASCPGATVTERSGRGRGRVIFRADGTATRVAESQLRAGISIPAVCTAVVSCEVIEGAIAGAASSATCTSDADGVCNCEAIYDYALDNESTYGVEGNVITAPLGKRWNYCVSGGTMAYQDVSAAAATREPGTVQLGRR